MFNSASPHRRQPIRLLRPWDSPGKNTGVGCHFLLQCMKVKSEREVTQACLTLSDPMDCSLPGSSIHGIFHARVLEWVAIAFSSNYTRYWKKIQLYLNFYKYAINIKGPSWKSGAKIDIHRILNIVDIIFWRKESHINGCKSKPPPHICS